MEIDLTELPHAQIREVLKSSSDAPVYLLVNPIEYHGPHLPLKNDYLLSIGMARDLHQKLNKKFNQDWPFIQTAPLHIGVGPAPGLGTVAASYRTVKKMVTNTCRSLEHLGAKRIVVMTFHGDPLHNLALDAAVRDLHSRGIRAIAPFSALLNLMLTYQSGKFDRCFEGVADPVMRKQLSTQMVTDLHAGFFETSLMLHYWPELVSPSYPSLPPCPEYQHVPFFTGLSRIFRKLGFKKLAAELDFVAIGLGWVKLKDCPGYTSSPHLANAISGKAFAEEVLHLFIDASVLAFNEVGHSPEPILKWTLPLTLGGRVAV